MSLNCGIVGLPNVGKSTLFNALSETAKAQAANYPFCTIEPNIGVVAVPDPRLDALSALYHPKKTTPASLEFVDIAGLVKGASKGEGLHHVGYRVADCAVALQSVKDAGGRVIEQATHDKLPDGFQTAEFLLAHGMVDAVVERGRLRDTVGTLIRIYSGRA